MKLTSDAALQTLEQAVDTLDQILRWRSAAMRVGEELASVGPDGYYAMTPEQWRDWCLRTLTAAQGTQEARAAAEADRYLAQRDALRIALEVAIRTIRVWHGMGMGANEPQAWALYQASPEMQQIVASLRVAEPTSPAPAEAGGPT